MKRKTVLRILLAVILTILLLVGGFIAYVAFSHHNYIEPDTSDWKTGDLFFSVGDSWKSVAVRSLTGIKGEGINDSVPSHCGLIINTPAGLRLVHESTEAGHVVSESVDEYLQKNGAYCIYSMPAPYAVDTLKLKSDIDSLLERKVPFDFSFDHGNDEVLYCSEMVVKVSELNGYKGFSDLRNQNYIYPEDILKICRSRRK